MDEVSYGWSAHLQNEKMMRHENNILDWLEMGKGRNIYWKSQTYANK